MKNLDLIPAKSNHKFLFLNESGRGYKSAYPIRWEHVDGAGKCENQVLGVVEPPAQGEADTLKPIEWGYQVEQVIAEETES